MDRQLAGEQSTLSTNSSSRRYISARSAGSATNQLMIIITNKINIKLVNMKKEEISTPTSSKTKSYFRYELKDTNQVLKEAGELQSSFLLTPNHLTNEQNSLFDDTGKGLIEDLPANLSPYHPPEENPCDFRRPKDQYSEYQKYLPSQKKIQFQNAYEINQGSNQNSEQQQSNEDKLIYDVLLFPKKTNPMLNDSNLSLNSIYRDKGKDSDKYEEKKFKKEDRKQKKGLANISLKVKNIVAQYQRLTYKEVSDCVLLSLTDELQPLEKNVREREIKNIRRRVYDALNVLVSVGILGKKKRFVCLTPWTNIQGKKLSQKWQLITEQQQKRNLSRKICEQKEAILNSLVKKYQAMAAIRARNEVQLSQQTVTGKKQQESKGKVYFPFFILMASYSASSKNMLTFQQDPKQRHHLVKFTSHNPKIKSDVDVAAALNLKQYAPDSELILEEIKREIQEREGRLKEEEIDYMI